MAYTLTEAAKATGLNKTTVFRAIRAGKVSATRDATSGQWTIEPAELHRVYPPVGEAIVGNVAAEPIALVRNAAVDAELRETRALLVGAEQRIADKDDVIADLRRQRDRAQEALAAAQE